MVATCLPSGARDGSWTVGKHISMWAPVGRDPGTGLGLLEVQDVERRAELEDAVVVRLRSGARLARHPGQPVQREVDLDAGAVGADVAHRAQEVARQVPRVAERLEGVLGIGAGQHHVAGDGRCRPRAARPATWTPEPESRVRMRSTATPVRISAPASRAASAIASGHLAHAAAHEPPAPQAAAGVVGDVVVQQDVGGPERAGAGQAVVDGVPAQRGPDVRRLEPLAQVVVGRRRQQEQRLVQVLAAAQRVAEQRREGAAVAAAQVARR